MRAMVILVLAWGLVISATPGIVDRYVSGASSAAQPVVFADADSAPAAALRNACRRDDDTANAAPAATMIEASYDPAGSGPNVSLGKGNASCSLIVPVR